MTANIKIYGSVQGVFFRRSAKEIADKLGLTGWVRNASDGSVEIMAVGPKDRLDKFVVWCKKGPPLAEVDKVEIDWVKKEESFDGFEIIS